MAVLWLGEADVEALVDPAALVDGLAEAFANLARFTERDAARIDGTDGATGYLSVFPAVDHGGDLASAKVLAGGPPMRPRAARNRCGRHCRRARHRPDRRHPLGPA